MTDITGKNLRLDVVEVERPEIDAHLVAEGIAEQLGAPRLAKARHAPGDQRAMRSGAKGIKMLCRGRLAGAEMARREWVREGRVPLHTLRADIDYATRRGVDHLRAHRRQGVDLSRRCACPSATAARRREAREL